MIHKLAHFFGLNKSSYELWWVQIANRKKMMGGDRCLKCGSLTDVHPAGYEIEYETYA